MTAESADAFQGMSVPALPSIEGKTLVFIMALARSGTTWLREMLSQHPAVASANETHLFNSYLRSFPHQWRRMRDHATGLHVVLSEEEFLALCRGFADGVLAGILRRKPEACVVLEKTPSNVRNWKLIDRLYPKSHFICLVRDPRAVAASYRAASTSWAGKWAGIGSLELATRWCEAAEEIRAAAAARPNVHVLRFEDLRADPARTIDGLFRTLGLETDEERCRAYVEACSVEAMRQRTLAVGGAADFVRRGTVQGWREELDRRYVARIEAVAQQAMRHYGYEPITSGRATLARALDGVTGSLRWRMNRLADRIQRAL